MVNLIHARLTTRSDRPSRTPSLRQIQETECGVVAMAILLAHYGAWVPLPELRCRCTLSEHGVTALSLIETGKHYGLSIRAMRLSADALRHVQAPVILFWEYQHFLVLEGIRGNFAWVNDPARGHRTLSLAALKRGYSGVALIAQPGPAFRQVGSPRQPFHTAADLLRPGRWWLALLGAAVLAESLLLPLMILLIGDAIGDGLAGRAVSWRSLVLSLAGILIAHVSQRWLAGSALAAITRPILRRLIRELANASTSFIQGRGAVALTDRLQVVEYPATTAVHTIMAGIRLAVAMPLLVLILARIHPMVAVVALAALTASYFMQQPTVQTAASLWSHFDEEPRPRAVEETEILHQRRRVRALGGHLAALSPVRSSRATAPTDQPGLALRRPRLEMWLPILRPSLVLSPAIAVGVFVATDTDAMAPMIVALLASWYGFRLVESAAEAIALLYVLPETLVQLLESVQKSDVGERAA